MAGEVGIDDAFDFGLLFQGDGLGVCRSNPRLMQLLFAGLGGLFCFLLFGVLGFLCFCRSNPRRSRNF